MVERQSVNLKVVGSSPITHPLFTKILKKIKKKKLVLFKHPSRQIILHAIFKFKKTHQYYNYILQKKFNLNTCKLDTWCTKYITFSCKTGNPKNTISGFKTINTFSIGSIIVYLRVKQGKFIRRNLKGLNIFMNFLQNILRGRFLQKNDNLVFMLDGCDFNTIKLKKNFFNFFLENSFNKNLFLFNINIPFTKVKFKKIKSIKKRIKKKLIKSFLKNHQL